MQFATHSSRGLRRLDFRADCRALFDLHVRSVCSPKPRCRTECFSRLQAHKKLPSTTKLKFLGSDSKRLSSHVPDWLLKILEFGSRGRGFESLRPGQGISDLAWDVCQIAWLENQIPSTPLPVNRSTRHWLRNLPPGAPHNCDVGKLCSTAHGSSSKGTDKVWGYKLRSRWQG